MEEKIDPAALFHISYGLYIVTARSGGRDNGLVVNTVTQVSNAPDRVAVTVSKQSFTHDLILESGMMNVCCLSESAPYSLFERFGFQSGRTADKFAGLTPQRTQNGLAVLHDDVNAYFSLEVAQTLDLGTHTMFIAAVTESRVLADRDSMTYAYYRRHLKPKPQKKKGYVCTVCGWVYEGAPLPADILCPICLHGAADFQPLQ